MTDRVGRLAGGTLSQACDWQQSWKFGVSATLAALSSEPHGIYTISGLVCNAIQVIRHEMANFLGMFVFFMAFITTLVLCARSQNLVMSVSVHKVVKVHVVFSTAEFKGGGKSSCKVREATRAVAANINVV